MIVALAFFFLRGSLFRHSELSVRLVGYQNLVTCSIPVDNSGSRHFSEVPNLYDIFPSIASRDHSLTVIAERNRVTADIRTKDISDGPSYTDVVDLYSLVPSARDNLVLVDGIPFNTENAVGVAGELKLFFHCEGQGLGSFVVDPYVFVPSRNSKQRSVGFEVQCVQMILFILLRLVQAFAARGVPMF